MFDTKDLQNTFSGDLLSDQESLNNFRKDASIFEATPKLIARPKSIQDISSLINFATAQVKNGHQTSLTASCGRTDMTGGSISEDVIVDFSKYLNHIGEIETDTITVEPGAFYRDFEKKTLEHNLIMPSFPASKSICAVGGMVGNNSGGELSLKYGQTVNFVKELEVVLADGNTYTLKPWNQTELLEIIKQDNFLGKTVAKLWQMISENKDLIQKSEPTTSKNSSGYYLWKIWDGKFFDLTKLFTGSQGTLGIITKIKFQLVPIKQHKKLLVIFLHEIDKLGDIVNLVKKSHPESMELFDDHTLKLALRFFPDIAKKMKAGILKLLWQFLPEAFMALSGGLPRMVILVEFAEDSKEEAEKLARNLQSQLQQNFKIKTHITKDEGESQKYWTIRRESFNLLRQHAHGKISSPFVEDIIVHTEQLPEFLPRLTAIFSRYPSFEYTIAGHAGDANFHIIPFVDLKNPEERKMVERLSEEVYTLIKEFKGSITAEHNDGISHGVYLSMMFGPEILELFRQTKALFDPLNIFNPHKKIQATFEYFEKHLRKE